jgi:hypothetical protein
MIVQLGKFGDCVNILPFAYMLSKKLGVVNWLVGRTWASLLEGVSYVNPIIWEGSDNTLPQAIAAHRGKNLWITQAWLNPDRHILTDSFATEQWRYVGALDEYGKWPLVFDKRSPEREAELVAAHIPSRKRPVVLVATTSVSTPYRYADRLLARLRGLDAEIIDMNQVQAKRVYDLLGLYDAADLLVTVDTVHIHLARASQIPVIFLQNDGWRGAPVTPNCVASWRYSELGQTLGPVFEAAKNQLERQVKSVAVVFQTYDQSSERHQRAMKTHPKDAIYSKHDYPPTMKEMLQEGLDAHKDVIVFSNDDVSFPNGAIDKIKRHAQKFDFGCSRRPRIPVHCGREIFWFRDDWLRKNWHIIPNPFWSVQRPDLIMCRWLRQLKGIPTTVENLNYDFPPVDVPDVIYHEDHPSHWNCDEILNSREGLHNEALWAAGV